MPSPIFVAQDVTSISFGELQGATSATQLPNVPCGYAVIKARSDNAGSVFIGKSTVTAPDGTTDTTTGIELDAGQAELFFVENLNFLYRICENAGDDCTYMAYVV